MNKDYNEIVEMLIENPAYSSDWIDIAAKLISEFGYTTDKLEKFNPDQLNIIYNANKTYGDHTADPDENYIDKISNPKLNVTQMQLIDAARSHGFWQDDLYRLVDPELTYSKLNYLVQSLIDGFDIAKDYNPKELSAGQIYELYAAYKSKVDISKFFNPNDTHLVDDQLALIRHALELGLNVDYDVENNKIIIG